MSNGRSEGTDVRFRHATRKAIGEVEPPAQFGSARLGAARLGSRVIFSQHHIPREGFTSTSTGAERRGRGSTL